MAQARSENFPVASRLLPANVRSHLLAIYGFARLVDDIGDEVSGNRLALLDSLETDLERAFTGMPGNPLLIALKPTIAQCQLPIEPFRRLIEANRRDQLVHRYQSFDELVGYCALSANPVGELVLRVFGVATPARIALSDQICTGLQLVEHWQDVAEDNSRGRIYLPADDRDRFGVTEDDLAAAAPTPAFCHLLAFEVARAHELLDHGAPLIRTLKGRPALAIAAFVAGGRAALAAIEQAGFDVLSQSRRPGPTLKATALIKTLLNRSARR
jgi:squalene synthase HpnC